ncbi:MAG: lipopolysaccharide core heptose(I) kinase RfaP [Coraliomargarita sp.]
MYIELSKELEERLTDEPDLFGWFLTQQGDAHRDVKNRLTYEVHLEGLHFYVKRHLGCGWGEVIKEWYRLRKPVVSARTEWEGAEALATAGVRVPKVLGKGERGAYPHAVESFVALEALEDCETLEYFKEGWLDVRGNRWVTLKQALINEVGTMTGRMHRSGINHRDCYLCHFLINRTVIQNWQPGCELPLTLIDLHRVQQRSEVPTRWQVKDLRSLIFSAMDVGLTSADCGRFLKAYLGSDWKAQLRNNSGFWKQVIKRALNMYNSWHKRTPTLPKLLKSITKDG